MCLAEVKVSIMIEYYAEFVLAIPVAESLGDPGATHIFSVDITNNANIEDSIDLEIMMLPEGWEACILVNSICSSDISVGKGQTSSFEIQITTNDNEAANIVNGVYLRLNAISGLNDKEVHDVYFTVFTNPVYDLSIEIHSRWPVAQKVCIINFAEFISLIISFFSSKNFRSLL